MSQGEHREWALTGGELVTRRSATHSGDFADSASPVPWGFSLRGGTLQKMPDSTATQREFAEAGRYPQKLLVDAY